MGRALELVTAFNDGDTAFADSTPFPGNSLTVRSTAMEAQIQLLEIWSFGEGIHSLRLRSPRLHDNVDGFRVDALPAGAQGPFGPRGISQKLISQDQLQLQMLDATDVVHGAFLVYYEDLPGIDSNLITAGELRARVRHILTVHNTLTVTADEAYTGEETLIADADLLKANVNYAILGYTVSAAKTAVRYRGSDIGNLGVGGPGYLLSPEMTNDWFVKLSELYQLPTIPVFNAANKAAVLIDCAAVTGATDVTVSTVLAELS